MVTTAPQKCIRQSNAWQSDVSPRKSITSNETMIAFVRIKDVPHLTPVQLLPIAGWMNRQEAFEGFATEYLRVVLPWLSLHAYYPRIPTLEDSLKPRQPRATELCRYRKGIVSVRNMLSPHYFSVRRRHPGDLSKRASPGLQHKARDNPTVARVSLHQQTDHKGQSSKRPRVLGATASPCADCHLALPHR